MSGVGCDPKFGTDKSQNPQRTRVGCRVFTIIQGEEGVDKTSGMSVVPQAVHCVSGSVRARRKGESCVCG